MTLWVPMYDMLSELVQIWMVEFLRTTRLLQHVAHLELPSSIYVMFQLHSLML